MTKEAQKKRLSQLRIILMSLDDDGMRQAISIYKQAQDSLQVRSIVEKGLIVGATVTFEARGRSWRGTIMSVGRKRLKVSCDTATWKISPSLVQRVA